MSAHSVNIAKERLKNLLTADRMQCAPEAAQRLPVDLYHTISKYVEIRPEDFNIEITRTDIHIKYMGEKN